MYLVFFTQSKFILSDYDLWEEGLVAVTSRVCLGSFEPKKKFGAHSKSYHTHSLPKLQL